MTAGAQEWIDLSREDVQGLLDRVQQGVSEEDFRTVKGIVDSFLHVTRLLDEDRMTIRMLRQLMGRGKSEKTSKVLDDVGADPPPEAPSGEEPSGEETSDQSEVHDTDGSCGRPGKRKKGKGKRKGHGRNGRGDYPGAKKTKVSHPTAKPGEPCLEPNCPGTLYEQKDPGFRMRIFGNPCVEAHAAEVQKCRCALCGKVFTAPAPEGFESDGPLGKKYTPSAGAMICLLKFGAGVPYNRLANLQASFGVPLPASTQSELAARCATLLEPAFDELKRQAAQGETVHNDDTSMLVLSLQKENDEQKKASGKKPTRTGMFTSCIVSLLRQWMIVLFFTGRKHVGENLGDVLEARTSSLPPPIQMCDALDRNLPKEFKVILANCLVHGRRKFVNTLSNFPDECRHVLLELAKVYRHDAVAKENNLTPRERLEFHQRKSRPVLDELRRWMTEQLDEKLVEPNSALGKAIRYMLKRWDRLTLFLQVPGAPLDNNTCELSLRKVVLHRKNALFYKTLKGAHVGDVLMSLIETCLRCGANPYDYLTELLTHHAELAAHPHEWLPWNYRETLERERDAAA